MPERILARFQLFFFFLVFANQTAFFAELDA